MTHTAPGDVRRHPTGSPWAAGKLLFAGVMLVINGVFAVLFGIMALAKNPVFVVTHNYVFKFDLTAWGWIHLIMGAILLATGMGVLARAAWGTWAGIGVASIAMFMDFLFLPYYPLWALIGLIIDGFVIWALATADDQTGLRAEAEERPPSRPRSAV